VGQFIPEVSSIADLDHLAVIGTLFIFMRDPHTTVVAREICLEVENSLAVSFDIPCTTLLLSFDNYI
jgi:hypothetical protein